MKKLLLILVLLAIPASADSVNFFWRFKPVVGSQWTGRYTRNLRTAMNLPLPEAGPDARPAVLRMDWLSTYTANYDMDVLGRDSRGFTTVRLFYRDIGYATNSYANGQASPPAVIELANNRFRSALAVLQGASLTFKVTPTGRVIEIDGGRDLKAEVNYALSSSGVNTSDPLSLNFSDLYEANGLENLVGSGSRLPAKSLVLAQAYTFTETLENPERHSHFGVRCKRTLARRSGGISTFSEIGQIQYSALGGRNATAKLASAGTSNATLTVAESSGVVTRWAGQSHMKGQLHLPGRNNHGKSSIPLDSRDQFTFTLQPRPEEPGPVVLN